jgi:hypothetical protein
MTDLARYEILQRLILLVERIGVPAAILIFMLLKYDRSLADVQAALQHLQLAVAVCGK